MGGGVDEPASRGKGGGHVGDRKRSETAALIQNFFFISTNYPDLRRDSTELEVVIAALISVRWGYAAVKHLLARHLFSSMMNRGQYLVPALGA
jgi:hypothetical protein